MNNFIVKEFSFNIKFLCVKINIVRYQKLLFKLRDNVNKII